MANKDTITIDDGVIMHITSHWNGRIADDCVFTITNGDQAIRFTMGDFGLERLSEFLQEHLHGKGKYTWD